MLIGFSFCLFVFWGKGFEKRRGKGKENEEERGWELRILNGKEEYIR
jgi:hypothetical protein